jgi:hypothetical protein
MCFSKTVWTLLGPPWVLIALAGCRVGSDPPPPRNQADLTQIYEIYRHFIKSQEKPPADLTDLTQKRYQGIYPSAVKALEEGKYVVLFGVANKDSGTVLAYEKDAPTEGGAVLMANGVVKTMTAAQFNAAKPPP